MHQLALEMLPKHFVDCFKKTVNLGFAERPCYEELKKVLKDQSPNCERLKVHLKSKRSRATEFSHNSH